MNGNLNENTNPKVTSKVNGVEVTEEITTTVEKAANTESEAVDMTVQESIEAIEDNGKTSKKKTFLRVSVIIALCLVAAALLGYFTFAGFFLREPEGVTWSENVENTTYYYEFKNDGIFYAYVGSVEVSSTYQKTKGDDGDTITVGNDFGSLIANAPAAYTITGSRILGNQTLNGTYGEGHDFTLHQSAKKIMTPDLPEKFTPDEGIVGTWLFKYKGKNVYKVTFDSKGSMVLEVVQDGIKYNGVYTIDDSTINFTYCFTENETILLKYTLVDSDNLTFMNSNFVREGSAAAEATPDQ